MLASSTMAQESDWFMICDADEFYSEPQKEAIKKTILSTSADAVAVKARYFFFNFKNFIYVELPRLFRATSGMYFLPGQFPHYSTGKPYYSEKHPYQTILESDPMAHYSLVKRPTSEIKRRIMEYCAAQRERWIFDWIDDVLLKWTPERAEEIYSLNERKYNGKGGIIYEGGCEAQKLMAYTGPHPEIMSGHPFRHIDDVRKVEFVASPASSYVFPRHHFANMIIRTMQKISSVLRRLRL